MATMTTINSIHTLVLRTATALVIQRIIKQYIKYKSKKAKQQPRLLDAYTWYQVPGIK